MDNITTTTPAIFKILVPHVDGVPTSFVAQAGFATADQAAVAATKLPKSLQAKTGNSWNGVHFVTVSAQLRSVKGNTANETGCKRFITLICSYACEIDAQGYDNCFTSMDEVKAAIRLQLGGSK